MIQRLSRAALVMCCAALFTAAVLPAAVRAGVPTSGPAAVATPASKPLIVWYTRTGTSQLVAETLQKQLGCDMERIPSTKDRGIFSIVNEQLMGGADEQQKFSLDLAPYGPVIIATPIYFMKLSAPARAFLELNKDALKGKDIHIFLTLGGKLGDGKIKEIKEYGAGLGLNIKEVAFLQTGKTEEFPARISELVKAGGLQAKAAQ